MGLITNFGRVPPEISFFDSRYFGTNGGKKNPDLSYKSEFQFEFNGNYFAANLFATSLQFTTFQKAAM